MANIWLDGIMGVVVGDALGVPAEFSTREELMADPVEDMIGYGTYNLPAGSWSDDSSMALATLDSLRGGYDLKDMMDRFVAWYKNGEYTPYGEVFDIGNTCARAIGQYLRGTDAAECGGCGETDNGNGSLMRIMPICLYLYQKQEREGIPEETVIQRIHEVSALTHGHLRSKIACGLYYFLVRSILKNNGTLQERLQKGADDGFGYYGNQRETLLELAHYSRIRDMEELKNIPMEKIKSGGYVVDTFEAALWSLLRTDSYREATLTAVNLGSDTDTVAAIAGGLAGLYYGYEGIPTEWIGAVARREWVEGMCR